VNQLERNALMADQLLASSSDGIMAFDGQFRLLYWSVAMEKIWGLPSSDVLGQRVLDLFPFLVASGEDQLLAAALAGRETVSHDRSFSLTGTGRRGSFEGRYRPLRDESGHIVGGIGVIRDVTEQKEAEQQLFETETRFRNMADVSPVLLWMSGTDGLCTFFNQTWLHFTGRTLDQEWGVGWAEGVHFEDFQLCMDTYVAAFNERRVFEMEYRLRRADGEFRWILDHGSPRYTPEGIFAGYIGSCVDITERKLAEAELRAAVQARDEFLSVASHELKTPLTSMQLQIDGLDRMVRLDGQHALRSGRLAKSVSSISGQAVRMGDLVNVLLDVSRIASGRLEFDSTDVDMGELAQQVVDRWRPAAAAARCELVLQIGRPVHGLWDRLRLEQVFNNLLSNAVKYGQGKQIEVEIAGDERMARFRVSDRGIGISVADQGRIFQRFERAVPARNYGGMGLGLWICRQIVEGMGGAIRLESTPGQGATFLVELPTPTAPRPSDLTPAPLTLRPRPAHDQHQSSKPG
jgi:PAS domain S-box-containing protein